MKRILSVSHDPSLLSSRESVLRLHGLDVTSAVHISEAFEHCSRGGFDLLIAGHTIPEESAVELIRRLRQYCSDSPVLVLHTPLERPVVGAEYTFECGRNPAELVALVRKILGIEQAPVTTATEK